MTSSTAVSQNPLAQFAVISFDRHPDTSTHVAQQVTERLKAFGLQNLSTINVDDLTPELAGQLARVDYAIFIDSPSSGNRVRVKVRALEALGNEPAGSSIPATGHSCDPGSLLALTHSAYGRHPQSWLVQVYMPKIEFVTPGDMEEALDQAISQVEGLMSPASKRVS
jgi:Ni,Fe-hydrogenase maturation factor